MSASAKKKIRIGVLGFGAMGRTHTWAVRNVPFFYDSLPFRAITAGVCTTSLEKSRRIAEEFDISLAASCEDELINHPEIDVIDICTPNVCHFETLKKALRAKKHVLCEKPLCISPAQAKEILSVPREGLTCGMVFHNRFLAPVMRAKQILEEGRLGRILSFRGAYLHNSAADPERNAGWKQDATVCGGGVLFDLGSHVIDLISHLCGPIDKISGTSQIAYPERRGMDGSLWKTNADEAFYMTAVTKDGAKGTMEVGKLSVGTNDDLSFEIYGEKGALHFSLMEPNWLYYYDGNAVGAPMGGMRGWTRIECVGRYPDMIFPSPKAPVGWLWGHLHSMYSYLLAVATGADFFPSLEDGAYVQAVMDAAYRSDADASRFVEVESC